MEVGAGGTRTSTGIIRQTHRRGVLRGAIPWGRTTPAVRPENPDQLKARGDGTPNNPFVRGGVVDQGWLRSGSFRENLQSTTGTFGCAVQLLGVGPRRWGELCRSQGGGMPPGRAINAATGKFTGPRPDSGGRNRCNAYRERISLGSEAALVSITDPPRRPSSN